MRTRSQALAVLTLFDIETNLARWNHQINKSICLKKKSPKKSNLAVQSNNDNCMKSFFSFLLFCISTLDRSRSYQHTKYLSDSLQQCQCQFVKKFEQKMDICKIVKRRLDTIISQQQLLANLLDCFISFPLIFVQLQFLRLQ